MDEFIIWAIIIGFYAPLHYLLPEVREAVIQVILDVARRFPIIRFDAAMTLARKHFRRLWYPPPGGSAGVPSRSAFWMSDADFAEAFPVEFWREVVDRINREVPDTLLIAEAFWLMESYFVRNLGMHRVYNSAFMNLLKREENAKYRKILKDILAYNPEIMKRYVNFMNNPDEATDVEQFGIGDKYFGVATLLATLTPAWQASRTPPLTTLSRAALEVAARRGVKLWALIGLVLMSAGLFLALALPGGIIMGFAGLFALVLGTALLAVSGIFAAYHLRRARLVVWIFLAAWGGLWWFGGGSDLNPCIEYDEDTAHFHAVQKEHCDRHAPDYYDRFKAWADEYFYVPHRGRARGVGGIFYDDRNTGDWEADFAFTRAVGEAFLPAFLPVTERRRNQPWTDVDKEAQLASACRAEVAGVKARFAK